MFKRLTRLLRPKDRYRGHLYFDVRAGEGGNHYVVQGPGGGGGDLWRIDPGGGPYRLSRSPYCEAHPAWGADGEILYSTYRLCTAEPWERLFAKRPDGTLRQVVDGTEWQRSGVWIGEEGTVILSYPSMGKYGFGSNAPRHFNLDLLRPDGTMARIAEKFRRGALSPGCALGSDIFFIGSFGGGEAICRASLDGGAPVRVGERSDVYSVTVSPAGDLIAYITQSIPGRWGYDVFVSRPDGKEERRLTERAVRLVQCRFDPSGGAVLYSLSHQGFYEIRRVSLQGEDSLVTRFDW